jgi:hypothetical protein
MLARLTSLSRRRRQVWLAIAASLLLLIGSVAAYLTTVQVHPKTAARRAVRAEPIALVDPPKTGGLSPSLAQRLRIDPARASAVGVFHASNGDSHDLYRAPATDANKTCLVDIRSDSSIEACASDLFSDGPIHIIQEIARPPTGPAQVVIVGLAQSNVSAIDVKASDGSTRSVSVSRTRAFIYEPSSADGENAVEPIQLVAHDENGAVVGRTDIPSVGQRLGP